METVIAAGIVLLPLKAAVEGINENIEVLGEAAAELRAQTILWRKQCTRFTFILGDLNGRLKSEGSAK
jgi:hypothetical protein